MEPEARYTLIGVALLGLVAALIIGLIWLARGGVAQTHRYSIYFEHHSLEGLQIGGDVAMRGIKVGQVEQYQLARDNLNRVHVVVRIDGTTPINRRTHAVVSRNMLTGLARIDLVNPDPADRSLAIATKGEAYPVISEGKSDFDQITGTVNRVAQLAESFLNRADNLLARQNQEQFMALITNLNTLVTHLDQRVHRVDEVASSLRVAAHAFEQASLKTTVTAERLNQAISPLSEQALMTLQDISQTARTLREQTERLSTRLDHTADSTQRQIATTARELQISAESIARAADRLQEPRAALLGPSAEQLGPGEKLP